MVLQTVNPTTNKVIQSFTKMTDEQVDEAVAKAAIAYESWKNADYKTRANILFKVAGFLRQKKDVLAKMITLEIGKLLVHAEGEIKLSAELTNKTKNIGNFNKINYKSQIYLTT